MTPLYGHNEEVAHWVAQRIPYAARWIEHAPFGEAFGKSTAIGVLDDEGYQVAGVVYHDYDPFCRSIEMSFAADAKGWATRPILRLLMAYPFDVLGCQRVTTITPKRNREARAFIDAFGFKREGVVRRGFGDDAAIVSGMLVEEWRQSRWLLGPKDRKALRPRPAETPPVGPTLPAEAPA